MAYGNNPQHYLRNALGSTEAAKVSAAKRRAIEKDSKKALAQRGCLHVDAGNATRCGKPTQKNFAYCDEHR